jgi:type I restriction enzyme R subunit
VTPLGYGEDSLIEKPCIDLFHQLGWETVNAYSETWVPGGGTLGRETSEEVVLGPRLRAALQRLNPGLTEQAINLAMHELTRDRSALSPAAANADVYRLLKDGVRVSLRVGEEEEPLLVRVIDWDHPEDNDFLLVSQFWMSGEIYKKRADLVGFVNGIPLVFIELKAAHRRVEDAYNKNLRDYRTTIPQMFWFNALIILSNGSLSRIGSVTAGWEHFADWKKINSEGEEGTVSLETMVRGTCEKARLLDLVENFTLFSEVPGGLVKMLAKNHQYLGVNNAFEAVGHLQERKGRLGVFWHTQGSGKSFSMVFFSQKVLRKLPGSPTFVIITDRRDLDDQIYRNFAGAGAITEAQVQAESGDDLKRLLKEDHRYVFTLIQKFHTDAGELYPKLSDRSDIIVITDEAHRSQYDIFAANMRSALPNASFIGFTGTPLMAGEEKTREVFGDYISIYNFRESIEDGATVPLYYENRTPELQIANEKLEEQLAERLEEADLTEDQERKLEREFAREYQLITREDRLDTVATDIVDHFLGRGFKGKGMVVSIDKRTAVKMYTKVRRGWDNRLEELRTQVATATEFEKAAIEDQISYMEETDMAVVVSPAQNEIEDFRAIDLDIEIHRRRMATEKMDVKFKNPDDPFRLVFVCAMWMTGFDAPACSTIYLDKPMHNHTLMQTIARANRVFRDKTNGLIVDYIGVFRDLQKALAIYGTGAGGRVREGERPVKDKGALVAQLRDAVEAASGFCAERGIELSKIEAAQGFERVALLDDAVDAILTNDEAKRTYSSMADRVGLLYRAILPDPDAVEFNRARIVLGVIAQKIRSLAPEIDISEIVDDIEHLLDEAIIAEPYVIRERGNDQLVDLGALDFYALRKRFEEGRKHTEAERLRGAIGNKLGEMVVLNKTRINLAERFQQMIAEYNAGSQNVQLFFEELLAFAKDLGEEEKRGISEGLSEEELAVFDLLTKPEPKLNKKEEQEVKRVARELLETLKREALVLDWRKKQQARASVWVTVEKALDDLPPTYTPEVFARKCNAVYQHVYDSYYGPGDNIYEKVA